MNRFETITFVYNEEFLLPYYLKHYDFVDRFNIIYDEDSNDKTLEILLGNKKVNTIFYKFPDMMDDDLKAKFINKLYAGLTDTWVLNVDVDEFIFLNSEPIEKINSVALHEVFRHKDDGNLSLNISVKAQRCHGFLDQRYIKPIVVKSGLGIAWTPGNHTIRGLETPPALYEGAHWSNADPCFCVNRRVKNRKERQSQHNLQAKLTYQHHNITEKDVINYCKEHEDDPQVW